MKNFSFFFFLASIFCIFASISFYGCKGDPCKYVHCQNGGICSDGDCNCIGGYTGKVCQNPPNGTTDCVPPCVHGTCNTFGGCDCEPGWTGPTCATQISTDPCAGVVCQNGGYCQNGVCFCANGCTGPVCQTCPEVLTVNLGTSQHFEKLFPTKIGSGDKEFDAHGPNITASVELSYDDYAVYARIQLHEIETVSDWSEARLDVTKTIWYAPFGRKILSVQSANSYYNGVDNNGWSPQTIYPAGCVNYFTINGDTHGDDIGAYTSDDAYITVDFESIKVKVIDN